MAELMAVDNANPVVFQVAKQRPVTAEEEKDDVYDEIDTREVFGEFWWSINYLPVDDCIGMFFHAINYLTYARAYACIMKISILDLVKLMDRE